MPKPVAVQPIQRNDPLSSWAASINDLNVAELARRCRVLVSPNVRTCCMGSGHIQIGSGTSHQHDLSHSSFSISTR